jgi:hypothetical protein
MTLECEVLPQPRSLKMPRRREFFYKEEPPAVAPMDILCQLNKYLLLFVTKFSRKIDERQASTFYI